jgi:hypothetical protein
LSIGRTSFPRSPPPFKLHRVFRYRVEADNGVKKVGAKQAQFYFRNMLRDDLNWMLDYCAPPFNQLIGD